MINEIYLSYLIVNSSMRESVNIQNLIHHYITGVYENIFINYINQGVFYTEIGRLKKFSNSVKVQS